MDQPGDVLDVCRMPADDQRSDVFVDRRRDRRVALGEGRAAEPVQPRLRGVHPDHHQRQAFRGGDHGAHGGDAELVAAGPRR